MNQGTPDSLLTWRAQTQGIYFHRGVLQAWFRASCLKPSNLLSARPLLANRTRLPVMTLAVKDGLRQPNLAIEIRCADRVALVQNAERALGGDRRFRR